MLSLVLTVFFLNVAIYLVNTVGATTIDSLVRYLLLAWPDPKLTRSQLWLLYLKLPSSTSRKAREQSRLKREVLELKRDMNNTSSQDEFAKWAKLRRKYDKTMEEYEATSASIFLSFCG